MRILTIIIITGIILNSCDTTLKIDGNNPIIDGYFADPDIVEHEGTYYIYSTIDPWGSDELAMFITTDFRNFERKKLNWPTKEACTSPTSGSSMVWAPGLVKGLDGKFYMYVSVGSEIWAGVSDHPEGPWKNLKPDNSPLIPGNMFPGYHMIDAECFIDDDDQIWLYWGSGLNWVNGACFAVKLEPDMHTFVSEPQEITPPNFFEAPLMHKRDGIYYLMYSDGKAIDHTYKVRYSKGETPLGPWTEGPNSPILSTSSDSTVYGPGHHTVFTRKGTDYILYHQIYPQNDDYVLRQLYLDRLQYNKDGNILKIR